MRKVVTYIIESEVMTISLDESVYTVFKKFADKRFQTVEAWFFFFTYWNNAYARNVYHTINDKYLINLMVAEYDELNEVTQRVFGTPILEYLRNNIIK